MGENHSLALTNTGELYSWGHGDRGRLGVGMSQRIGVPDKERYIFPMPMPLHAFSKNKVSRVIKKCVVVMWSSTKDAYRRQGVFVEGG